MVGKYIPQFFADDELISSVVLSGGKGNTGGTERRQGMVAGIIAERMGLSEEEAWSEAAKFDEDLIANGHAFHEGANLEIRGQAYCNWLASDGLDGIKAIRTPINHIPLLAVGGVTPENLGEYLHAGMAGAGIGGAMVRKENVAANDFDAVAARAACYVAVVERL